MRIRDPGWTKVGSGIRIRNTGKNISRLCTLNFVILLIEFFF
jgi:hypothetical protein